MNRVEIPERNIVAEYPSCWDELTNDQFYFIMQNWLKVIDGKINQNEFLVIVLYNFLGITRSPFNNWKDRRLSKEQLENKFSNIWQLTETLTWLFRSDASGEGNFIYLDYTEIKNRIPEIVNSGEITLVGPADGMIDITFGEYRRAWDYFEAYIAKRNNSDLDRLIATLYRPERYRYEHIKHTPEFDGERREPFNPHLTEHYAELLAEVPFWQKQTIFNWFFNCDKFLKEGELELGGKTLSFAPLFSRKRNSDDDMETLDENDLGMTSLLFMIAESNLFGNAIQIERTSYIDILTALLYWKQQADKMKKT
jgi:hypothetical protein